MGSCALKQKRHGNSQKFPSITDTTTKRTDKNKSFLNPEIRAKILHAKDAKAPILKLQENQLRKQRMSQVSILIPLEIHIVS